MSVNNPLFPLLVYFIAFLTGYVIKSKFRIVYNNGRFEAIDGLRGFLGLGVFIYHSSIWFTYLRKGVWTVPESHLNTHLGLTSVSLFFMISSFLFISKLLNNRKKGMVWRDFFLNRLFRLTPMYLVSIITMIVIIMFVSRWKFYEGAGAFLITIIKWFAFTLLGGPDINGSEYSYIVNAGVQWSLHYEWLFYFSLPVIALFVVKGKKQVQYVVLSVIFITGSIIHGVDVNYIYPFLGGGIAAILLKYTKLSNRVNNWYADVFIVICLFIIGLFREPNNIYCTLFIAIVFNLIALGNSFFGLLKNTTIKLLGEVSYSVYLMHGILLFLIFYAGIGFEKGKTLSSMEFCGYVFLITPVLVAITFFCFIYIEKYFIGVSKKIGFQFKYKIGNRDR